MGLPAKRDDLVFDMARSHTYVDHTRDVAQRIGAGDLVVAELADMAERLVDLHMVALVAAGWCAGRSCSGELTDPGASPSGARHCRACRVGWSLVEENGRLRAVSRPWPEAAGDHD
ncbi:MAG TPA: hypothetical protein VIC57_16865 [Candidatus Dormibacteraeota bacterium]